MTKQIAIPSNLSEKTNLTRAQFLMWLGQQLNPEIPIYNMPLVFRINGTIEIALFQEAFQCLINDSDTMRMVVKLEHGIPMQQVVRACQASLIACSVPSHIGHPEPAVMHEKEGAVHGVAVEGPPLVRRCQDKAVKLVEGAGEVLPGFSLIPLPGHREHQVGIELTPDEIELLVKFLNTLTGTYKGEMLQ